MLKALIIDDEPLAHRVILHHLNHHNDVEVVKQCYNATEALAWLASHQADVLFLDINMPMLNGMDMLKVLANRPQVVIVSAYQEYALEGFELDVTDYLLKPVSAERLGAALEKVRNRYLLEHTQAQTQVGQIHAQAQVEPEPRHIVVKVDREVRQISLNDIDYLEAYGNYVKVWQGQQMVLANSTLKKLVAELPQGQFTQIHKSFVVRNSAVIGKDTESVILQRDVRLKVGKSFKPVLNLLLPIPN